MKKTICRIALYALIISALSGGVAVHAFAQQAAGNARPVPVIGAIVKKIPFTEKVEAPGTLASTESIDVMSTVTERVIALHFDDNSHVEKDMIMIELDASEEKAELEEQRSFLEEADRQRRRLAPLVKKGAASASVLDESRRIVAGARSRIDAIQARINRRMIRAPFSGTIGLRRISVGALAQPGLVMATLDDMRAMHLDFLVPEVFLSDIKKGATVSAKSEAYPDIVFTGDISGIDSRIDPMTRSVIVRALLDNTAQRLRPGMLMHVALEKNIGLRIVLPEEAVIQEAEKSYIYIAVEKDGAYTAERRRITLGSRRFGDVEAVSGVEEGDIVIIHGITRIRPGAAINLTIADDENAPLLRLMQKTDGAS